MLFSVDQSPVAFPTYIVEQNEILLPCQLFKKLSCAGQRHLIERSFSFEDHAKAQRFFRPIVENINRLQLQGLLINGKHLKFSFSTIVADNLAAHLIGGFQTGFSHGFFCRRCYITQPERTVPIDLIKTGPRTIAHHDHLVQRVNADPVKTPLMGVVGHSPMDSLIGFHPITSLPADIMHDFAEGVCPTIIMGILKQASSMRIMTYGERTFVIRQRFCESIPNHSSNLSVNLEREQRVFFSWRFSTVNRFFSTEYFSHSNRSFTVNTNSNKTSNSNRSESELLSWMLHRCNDWVFVYSIEWKPFLISCCYSHSSTAGWT
jgi:hypothetical protein